MNKMDLILPGSNMVIHQINRATIDSSWSKKVFPYPHHRIYFVTDGEAELKLKKCELTLVKGNIYLLPAFSLVESICRNTMTHWFIHFQTSPELSSRLFELHKPRHEVKSNEYTESFFKIIFDHNKMSTIYGELMSLGALQQILAPFFEGIPMHNPDMEKFSNVIKYINENLSNKIRIETLAKIMGFVPMYFANKFTSTLGIPPGQYILKKRLEAAQLLLINTDKKIKNIAAETGFSNEMYFSRIFTHKAGITPGEYRKRMV
jgi:AraC-like DNA-binding protein